MNPEELPESVLRATDGSAMPLERVAINGTLRDYAAEIAVEQHYRNPRGKNIEVVYTFPLPLGAVLLDVELQIGERRLKGMVVEKKVAVARYEDAVTDGDTAVMVEMTEPGLYTLNLGNLMAREAAVIRYRYALLLNWQGDSIRLVLPTTLAPRYGNPAKAGLAPHQVPETSLTVEYPLELRLSVQGRLANADISSPTHMITKTVAGEGVEVVLGKPAVLDRDFVLRLRGAMDNAARSFDAGNGQSVMLASLRVPPVPKRDERPLRLKVLIDCSGSMAGMSIAQARKAALEILKQLRPGDRFNFSLFGSSVRHFWPRLVPAEARYISLATRQLEALDADMGGTEMAHALQATYAVGDSKSSGSHENESVAQVLLITDGEVWEHEAIVKEAVASKHRVFTVGVGLSAVEGLVVDLAKQTGGACETVTPQEGMSERILAQFHRLRQPRLTLKGLRLGQKPDWFTPLAKAVFAGDTVHVFAGITGAVPGKVSMGLANAAGQALQVETDVTASDWNDLPRVAAAFRIAAPNMEDADRLALALEHQLLSEQTNLLIVAERDQKAENLPELAKVAHMLAAGWGGTGTSSTDDLFYRASPKASRVLYSRASPLMSRAAGKYDMPCFLRKQADTVEGSPTEVIFDAEGRLSVQDTEGNSPRDFIANLIAGLPEPAVSPDLLPKAIDVLEDYGLPADVATALREYAAEGWPERIVVAAFLMALIEAKEMSGDVPRDFSRLVFAGWKRSGSDQALLERIRDLVSTCTAHEWRLLPESVAGVLD